MMNASVPAKASRPMAAGLYGALGGFVAAKSGTSYPVHFAPSHHTQRLRSLHGLPSGSADARLYNTRRLAGQANPQPRCEPGVLGGSGLRAAVRFLSGAG